MALQVTGVETPAEAILTPREAINAVAGIVGQLRSERERLGLTRVDIENLGGPATHTLVAWERGRNRPTFATLIHYAALLKWRVELVRMVHYTNEND